MQQVVDAAKLFGAIHTHVSGELMQLMDGFYHNIEDGLFELVYTNSDQTQQRYLAELMKELRFRRKHLLKTFGKRITAAGRGWLTHHQDGPELMEERIQANELASKCAAHFGPVLQTIAERTAHATGRQVMRCSLPVSPEQVSYHFVISCRNVRFDPYSIATVQDLFSRFVLERLGAIYGRINTELEQGGFCTLEEIEEFPELKSMSAIPNSA